MGVLWESLGVLGGRLGVFLEALGVSGRSSGGPKGSLGRGQRGPKTHKVLSECLGGGLGGPWGDFGRPGRSCGSNPGGANVDISTVLKVFLQQPCFLCFFYDFFM